MVYENCSNFCQLFQFLTIAPVVVGVAFSNVLGSSFALMETP
jgi:hypothetical protein